MRLLIIGWDGADWEIVDDLVRRGDVPHVARLLSDGARGVLRSTMPTHSWAAWPSFLTGKHPAGHGVWDFVERNPSDPDRRPPVSSSGIRAETFLDRLSSAGIEVRAANIPVTFPPLPVNGRMISGVAIPRGARFVHPQEWAAELERRAPFPLNGMEWMNHRSDPEGLIDEARIIVEQRTAAYEVLLEGEWDVATCVYVAPDRLQHALGAYLLPTHPDHAALAETPIAEALRGVFRTLDEALDRLMTKSGPETTTILMSDHGFRPITRIANLRRLLFAVGSASPATGKRVSGSLRRSRAARAFVRTTVGTAMRRRIRTPSPVDWARSVAYPSALGGGVSINLKGREPNGIVDPRDFDRARREVADALLAYRDPETGEHPASAVVMREELPPGPHLDLAPDLFVRPEALWSFGMIDGVTSPTNWPSGTHRQSGILAASGPRISRIDLVDLAPTILSPYGLVPPDLDGKAIEEISGPSREPVRDAAEPSPTGRERMTEREEDEVARHLRELGYIE